MKVYLTLLKKFTKNKSLLVNIRQNQRQYSDKNVYNNIDREIKKLINEKN